LRELVAAERKIYPQGHWVSFRLDDLAGFLARHQRFEEAEQCYQDALAVRKSAHNEDSLFIGANLNNLAEIARKQGDLARAEEFCRQALAVYDRATEDHPETVALWRAEAAENLVAIQKEMESAAAEQSSR
jgi:tetratricopeptide (TPR) repeat protein